MADGPSDDAPRLPPRPAPSSEGEQLALDLKASTWRATAMVNTDWPAFVDPTLLPLRFERWTIVFIRVAAFLWSLALVWTAVWARANAREGVDESDTLVAVGRIGIIVGALIAASGLMWSDRLTRNVHRLGGRLPNRRRCFTAWLAPVALALLLGLLIVPIEPGELLDVRPAIIVPIIALAVWRPYSMVRRALTTLTRVRADSLIGTGYLLDLSAFGLIWWQLATLPDSLTQNSMGTADVFIGMSAAAAAAVGMSIVIWARLLAEGEHAQADRVLALRTRHDHRHLRLRGINPMDPDVRWALLRIRQEEELERLVVAERQRVAAGADRVADSEMAPSVAAPAATEPDVEPVVARATPAAAIADEAVETEAVEPEAVAPLVAEIVGTEASEQIIADVLDVIANADTSAKMIGELVDEVVSETESEIVDGSAPEVVAEPDDSPPPLKSDDAEIPQAEPEEPAVPIPAQFRPRRDQPGEFAARLRALLETDRLARARQRRDALATEPTRLARELDASGADASGAAPTRDRASKRFESTLPPRAGSASPTEAGQLPASLVERLQHMGNVGDDDISHRLDRVARRYNASDPVRDPQRSLIERLEEFGITSPVGGGDRPPVVLQDTNLVDEERWIPPRLYALEAVRYLMLLCLAAVGAASAWIVTRSVAVGSRLANGEIPTADVEQIDVARRWFITALGIALAIVALWCAVVTAHARKAGMTDARPWRCYALFGAAALLNVVAFVLDGDTRGTTSFLSVIGCLGAALVSISSVFDVVRWYDRRVTALTFWVAGLPFVVAMSWVGQLHRPVQATDALQALTFVSALLAIVAGIVLVLAALSTSDIEDAIRLSPALAETPPVAPPAAVGHSQEHDSLSR